METLCFNSSMVQLTAKEIPASEAYDLSFNSSMVQLTAIPKFTILFFYLFQFQYGAIDGGIGIRTSFCETGFQFQYGAIDG